MRLRVQAVKAIAIGRKNVEEEAIDILCKPEFTEVPDAAALYPSPILLHT